MKSIKSKLLLVFSLIFIPFIIVVIIAFTTFSQMEDDGVAINLSGSQRMRTMLISNYAVQLYNNDETIGDLNFAQETLEKEIQTYENILKALVDGNSDFEIGKNKDDDIVKSIEALDSKIVSYIDKSKNVLDSSASVEDINYITSHALTIKNDINAIVSMYQSNYNSKVSTFKTTLIGLTVFGVLMLIFGFVFAKKSIVNPIQVVNDKLKEIASGDGDLTHVLEVTSKDEIGRLSDNFNKFVQTIRNMVVEISASSENLEQVCDSLETITEEVSIASEKLTTITSEIADGATDQAHEVMSTAENLSELGEEINVINNISEVMKNNSIEIQGINDLSQDSMTGLQGRNTESIHASNEINDAVNVLYTKIQRISEITEVISGISAQTNLLALNASIEAARAGEHGRGFSVVADEVGKLAEESTNSTVEISSIVTEIQVQVNFTKELMGKVLDITENQSNAVDKTKSDFNNVSDSLDDMITKVNSVSDRIINVDSKKNDILGAIQNIASVSEETAAATEEVAAFADEFQASVNDISENAKSLRASSGKLSNMIGQFKY